MGGNAAEAHPCGFKWVTEAKAHNKAKLLVVDPRSRARRPWPISTRPYAPGPTSCSSAASSATCWKTTRSSTSMCAITPTRHRPRGLQVRGRHLLGLQRRKAQLRQSLLGLRARRGRLRQDRPHLAASAFGLPAAQAALLALHARDGRARLRHAQGQVPACVRDAGVDGDQGPRGHHPVRAGLDAALHRFADHPHRRDAAAAAGQYRRGRRRHERAARALQHPGPDRSGADVQPAAGL